MTRMRPALLLVALGCATAPSPRAFVADVYRADAGDVRVRPWEASVCAATFSPRLCALLERDRQQAGAEVGRLDGDPLYDAQDLQITELAFAGVTQSAERAEVAVTFRNAGTPCDLLLTLVPVGGVWRIDEITYRHERPVQSLTGILSGPR
jgi:hypothetical protein